MKLWLTIILFLGLFCQFCFEFGDPVEGVLALTLLILIITIQSKRGWHLERPGSFMKRDIMLICVVWVFTITIRVYSIQQYHGIGDLCARYAYGVVQILDGNYIFPCFPFYEFDESLVSFIMAPIIAIFGKSWTVFKVASIFVSSMIIPMSYYVALKLADRCSAFFVSGLLGLSAYMQRCDPLISMVRFNLVALMLLAILCLALKMRYSSNKFKWIFLMSLISGFAWYVHSMGRLAPIFACSAIIAGIFEENRQIRRKYYKGLLMLVAVVIAISVPMMIFILKNGAYMFYKKRQIFGFHENYPFSWPVLLNNIFITFTNFNYKAVLQAHFNDNYPLMRLVTASGLFGGIGIFVKNRQFYSAKLVLIILIITILPLCIITPGTWRGLYFTPAIVTLTIISGIWTVFAIKNILGIDEKKCLIAVGFILVLIGLIRIPTFYSGPQAAPDGDSEITRLYQDLASQPDVPHFFSQSVDQSFPGNAIYEYSRSAYLFEYYIFMFEP